MHIDKFKQEDNSYLDEEGCYYGDAEEYLQGHVLGFCGCGIPQASLRFVRDALRQVDRLKKKVWENEIKHADWQAENVKALGTEDAVYFMWYYLETKGWTEHGGSVPGWLTQSGIEMLEDLEELFKQVSEDEKDIL